MSRILITPRSLSDLTHPALERLRDLGYDVIGCTPGKTPTEDELIELMEGTVGWLAGVEPISQKVLFFAKSLKTISRNGTGIDNIDTDAAKKQGIEILRAQGTNARGVAELTLSLILDLCRSVSYCDGRLKQGEWVRRKGIELENRTLGLVGCGLIGQIVAKLGLALGMHVLAFDAFPSEEFKPSGYFSFTTLDNVIEQSDVISFHCPLSDDKPILGKMAFSRMKKGAMVINTARAGLVDDDALLEALVEGKISGYGTDVFHVEPPGNTPLLQHDRVIATSHIGGFTTESVDRATETAVQNMITFLQGVENDDSA